MLTTEHQYILSALRAELSTKESAELLQSNDEKSIASLITRNGVLLTIYNQLSPSLQTTLRKRYFAAQKQSIIQNYEGEQVLHALSDAGLSCIGLKGWELRRLYPDITMRQMADLDILVRPYDFHTIKPVMEKLGFSAGTESSWKHDSFKKNEVNVEIHKRLTDDSDAIQAWEKRIWDRAEVVDGNIYRMSPEDFYIFHFVHLHKDFLNGSLGLRRIVDTWLLQKEPVNIESVRTTLETFGMWSFHEKMVKLARATMGEEEMDDDTEVLLSHAFTHGIYGSDISYKAGRIATMGGDLKSGKLKSWLNAVFLPYSRMKAQFPILEKWPLLLPFCWIKRIVRFLMGDRKKYMRMMDYDGVSQNDYDEMKRFLKAGGVR